MFIFKMIGFVFKSVFSVIGLFLKSIIIALAVAFTIGLVLFGGLLFIIYMSPELSFDIILSNLAFLESVQ